MTKKHFFISAIIKTLISGLLYLAMPPIAAWYTRTVGEIYTGYKVLGMGLIIITNLIVLVKDWVLAFFPDIREAYLKEK